MNIINYIKKNKDNDFNTLKFNEVDALILSLLPYIDFTGIIPYSKAKKFTLKSVFSKLDKQNIKNNFFKNTFEMLSVMSNSKRFQDILLYNYMNIVNNEMQFGAITIKLPDKSIFIAFMGTDSSVVGWEEDFKMAYMYPVKSQKYANVYLKNNVKLFDRIVRVGGHSKGGNLAISSAFNSKWFIRRRIREIYNFDGPGFLIEQVLSKEYQSIEDRIKMYVPMDSVIGMILYHVNNYKVVKAKGFHLLQHDAFNWQIEDNFFMEAKQSKRSKNLEQKLTKRLENLSIPLRLDIVNDIFKVFKNNKITDTKEIKLKNIGSLIKDFKNIDKDTQNILLELLSIIFFSF